MSNGKGVRYAHASSKIPAFAGIQRWSAEFRARGSLGEMRRDG
jgi:hypothetical protein